MRGSKLSGFSVLALIMLVGLSAPNGLAEVMGLELVMTPLEAVLENGVLPESGGFRFRMV